MLLSALQAVKGLQGNHMIYAELYWARIFDFVQCLFCFAKLSKFNVFIVSLVNNLSLAPTKIKVTINNFQEQPPEV